MGFRYAFRGLGFVALAATAVYVTGSLYFHGSDGEAYRLLQDTGKATSSGTSEFVVRLDHPWLTALRIANMASIVAAFCGIVFIEWRSLKGIEASPLFSLPAQFAYSAVACLNDIVINTDLTDLDLSGAGIYDEGHIEVAFLIPLILLGSMLMFALSFGAKSRPVFTWPVRRTHVPFFTVVCGGLLLWMAGSEMVSLSCDKGYTNLLQAGRYPALGSFIFYAYSCLRIVLGRAAAPPGRGANRRSR